jgi:hypothetical protein
MKYGEMKRCHEEVIFNKIVAAASGDESILTKIVQGIVKITVEVLSFIVAMHELLADWGSSIADLLKEGKYDWVNDSLNDANFPATEHDQGKEKKAMALFHFNRNISSEDAIAGMKAEGYRLATVREMLVFGIKHPKLQLEFPIVALGQVVELYGYRRVGVLYGNVAGRRADLSDFADDWSARYRFLAVRI